MEKKYQIVLITPTKEFKGVIFTEDVYVEMHSKYMNIMQKIISKATTAISFANHDSTVSIIDAYTLRQSYFEIRLIK